VTNGSAALQRAATAGTGTTEAVINGKLFSCPDFSEAVQEDLPADSAHRQVRIATVIDEFSAASSDRPVETRSLIQANQVNSPCFAGTKHPYGTAPGFAVVDSLTGVLDDLLARRDRFLCEHTQPFDERAANAELKPGELRVETRNVSLDKHIGRAEQA